MSEQVGSGIYAGIPYIVAKKEGKLSVDLNPGVAAKLTAQGANLHLLDDIGDQNPDEVMAAMFESIEKQK